MPESITPSIATTQRRQRILVCGGRDFKNAKFVYKWLRKLHKLWGFEVVIEGDARGVDRMAGYWARVARLENIKEAVTEEDYAKYGRYLAPKVRNQRMIDKHRPDVVVAFPGGGGTFDMVMRAQKAQIEVVSLAVPSRPPRGKLPVGGEH